MNDEQLALISQLKNDSKSILEKELNSLAANDDMKLIINKTLADIKDLTEEEFKLIDFYCI